MVWSVETLNLTKDIAASHRARQEAQKQMRDNTRTALGQRQADLKEMKAQVQADLAQAGTERAEMNAQVQADLAQAETERTEQAKADLGQRQADLKEMKAQVQTILEKAKAELNAMNAQVQADLAQAETERAEMNAQVQADLAQAETERAAQARTDLKQRHAVTRNRIATIGEMLGKCRTERENASLAWQKLADVMYTKTEKPPTKMAVSPPEGFTQKVLPEGKVASGAGLKSTKPDKTQLPVSVFNYLTTHPAGIRMTELEKEFDVPRIHMAKITKDLLDSHKIEKREKLYFANHPT